MSDYKPIMKNEVPVYKEIMQEIFKTKKVYVLGYGSLLYSKGWERRGMKVKTKISDLIECNVNGFKRGPFGIHNLVNFYGVVPDANESLNGVLNPIHTLDDWIELMYTEYIAGLHKYYNYRVIDITSNLSGVKLPKNTAVHMVANELDNVHKYKYSNPCPGYYKCVLKGVRKERSKLFQNEFFKTGGYNMDGCKKLELTSNLFV